jgi:outer membrane protein TolC
MKCFILILLLLSSVHFAGAQTSVSLTAYLKEVESENLTLKASRANLDAAEARAVGIALPEPMIAVTQMRDDSGLANGYEVSQSIPFPTKLSNDRQARKLEAKAEAANTLSATREVLSQARLLYISTWAAQERIDFLRERRNIIQQHLKLSRASTRSDSSLQIHSLKAESDYDLLENEIIEAEQSLIEKQIALAEYAKKDSSQYRSLVLKEPPLTQIPSDNQLSSSSQLEAKRLQVEMLGARESEAKSSWLPDFNVRYRDTGRTPMGAGFNEVMVGATLPFVFFWEPNAKSKSASAEKLKAEAEFQKERLNVDSKTSTYQSRAVSLKKQIELIQNKLLPRAEKRMRLVRNLAPRDMESLQEHREGMEEFPDLKLKALDLRLQYEAAVAELSALASESK